MNPALLLNPTGKNLSAESIQRSSFQSELGSNGFQSRPNSQSTLAFEFSNTNGDDFETSQNNEYNSGIQYANSNPFPSSDPPVPPDFRSFSGSNPTTPMYSIPHHMANGLPTSPLNGTAGPVPSGMGSMIERMNNVQDRSSVPVSKRQKMMSDDDSEGKPKNGFAGRSSSGILSGYVKDKQRAGLSVLSASASGKAYATLDLTGGT